MSEPYIAKEYAISSGVGVSTKRLPSFDKALLKAKVGNYNLVRLSSILPAHCTKIPIGEIKDHVKEGSLLPVAYATITCAMEGTQIASAIGVGYPVNKEDVGVIMEYSDVNCTGAMAEEIVKSMVREGFEERGWELESIETISAEAIVGKGETVSTFACIAEW